MKNKASIRSNILKKRKALSANQVEKSEKKISLIWSRRNEDFKDKKVGFYWPTNNEISPLNILNEMLRRKIECYLPVISSDFKSKILVFRKYSSETILKKNSHGVNEPFNELDLNANSLDAVLVPLVAYDKEGYRIGMGGGYYDSTFYQQKEKKTLKFIGLAYQFQKENSCFPEQHDIKLDEILSPRGFESFRNLF